MCYFEFGAQAFCEPLLLYGWSKPEENLVWSDGKKSAIWLPIDLADHVSIQLKVSAFLPDTRSCSFYLFANGAALGRFDIEATDRELHFELRNTLLPSRFGLTFDFLHVESDSPTSYGLGNDDRLLNLAIRSIRVESLNECLAPIQLEQFASDRFSRIVRKRIDREILRQGQLRNKVVDDCSENRLTRAIQFYMYGHGGNQHHRRPTINRIAALVAECDGNIAVFASRKLPRSAVEKYCPTFSEFIFKDRSYDDVESRVVFPAAPNINFDPNFANPWRGKVSNCFGIQQLDAEAIFKCDSADLVVNRSQHIIVDRSGFSCFLGGNPADLSRLSLTSNIATWNGGIVLLQDEFSCTNIAHFLFDSVVRLYHWCKAHPGLVRRALFALGGVPTKFHELILDAASDLFGFSKSQFLFPQETVRLRPAEGLYWFASQCKSQHPANLMRRESLLALEEIARHVADGLSAPAVTTDKIYISRTDASLRRLANEQELCGYLRGLGFEIIVMSEHSWEEQIAIVSRARVVVGPHGMGLTHLAFNNGRPKVIEIFNPEVGSEAYALLCKSRGDDYHRVIGREIDKKKRDFTIDLADIQALLE
jgi:capsular polysaccharide biosynthesis protein